MFKIFSRRKRVFTCKIFMRKFISFKRCHEVKFNQAMWPRNSQTNPSRVRCGFEGFFHSLFFNSFIIVNNFPTSQSKQLRADGEPPPSSGKIIYAWKVPCHFVKKNLTLTFLCVYGWDFSEGENFHLAQNLMSLFSFLLRICSLSLFVRHWNY